MKTISPKFLLIFSEVSPILVQEFFVRNYGLNFKSPKYFVLNVLPFGLHFISNSVAFLV